MEQLVGRSIVISACFDSCSILSFIKEVEDVEIYDNEYCIFAEEGEFKFSGKVEIICDTEEFQYVIQTNNGEVFIGFR